jgi:hypothetical protein
VVAFVSSLLLTFALLALVPYYAKRRAPGDPYTWGEAMIASTYAFFLMFWVYGVVPHFWLTYADNELGWRSDNIVYGPGDLLQPQAFGGNFPLTLTFQAVRDFIVVGIYVVFLGLQMWLWSYWQNRGKKQVVEVAVSDYGRPLVKQS